ncbi:hypothetical protein [Chitinophaga sp. sic0106]|uniref:hypothetical protein n=1 Tax=Chitinophaga sp. sic0106 TaxID=2854785 RepID=UPI001C4720B5|nr:hypothetical protein [Chitinophaga sp. sic0106]MBV7531757.1 hypothetical protein [Chitinophaga sp. sic0106]
MHVRERFVSLLTVMLIICFSIKAQPRYLPSHAFIKQKVAENVFKQRPATTIPNDGFCITADEARNWLYLKAANLPTDGRLPWYDELLPCTEIITVSPIVQNNVYGACGSYIYTPGFNTNLQNNCSKSKILNNPFWDGHTSNCGVAPCLGTTQAPTGKVNITAASISGDTVVPTSQTEKMTTLAATGIPGPMNRCGIDGDIDGDAWYSATVTRTLSHAGIFYIGAAADNQFRILVDGTEIAYYTADDQAAFMIWHIVPVTLSAGVHSLTVSFRNSGSSRGFGVEMYDNTEAQLRAATSLSQLNIIFSTADLVAGEALCN